jgi:hypothetical protein
MLLLLTRRARVAYVDALLDWALCPDCPDDDGFEQPARWWDRLTRRR